MWYLEDRDRKGIDEGIYNSLQEYFQISNGSKLARFKLASLIEAFEGSNPDDKTLHDLWVEHQRLLEIFNKLYYQEDEVVENVAFIRNYKIGNKKITSQTVPEFSFLDLKLKIAERIIKSCYLCENRCMAERPNERGYCKVREPVIASEFLHVGEEAPLVPSHTIFFTGCTFSCVFCQNWDISQQTDIGTILGPKKLAKLISIRRRQGSRNVNFVGGDPTPQLYFILQAMLYCEANLPVVWNSNFYMSEEVMVLLNGFIDIYLSDFKFGNDKCAERFAGITNYWEIITRNHLMAKKAGNMIIRHLVLPGHVECCTKPVLKWIAENLGKDTIVNIMGQYRPAYKAHEYQDIASFPQKWELDQAIEWARELGLKNLI
jgi:putative pyruvate formate lyase activating enzyme